MTLSDKKQEGLADSASDSHGVHGIHALQAIHLPAQSYGHPSLRQEPSPLDTEITQCAAHTLAAPRYLISRVSSRRELHYRSGIGAAQRTPALHALVLSPRAEWIKLRRARTATLLPPPLLLPIPPHSANHTNKHNFELTKFLR